jgi:hypothetical protein
MRSIMIFLIVSLVLYTFYQDKSEPYNQVMSNINKLKQESRKYSSSTEDKNTDANTEVEYNNSDSENSNTSILQTKQDQPKKFDYKPEGVVERVITNTVSDFMRTEAGTKIAKSMIGVSDFQMNSNNFAFATKGFNPFKANYKIENITKTNAKKSLCGQRIKLNYILVSPTGKQLDVDVIEYEIGKHKVEELNILVDGLPLNEMVKSTFKSRAAISSILKNDSKNKVMFSVIEHITKTDFDDKKIKIFDDYITTSRPVMCGDKIEIIYKIMEIDGKVIGDEKVTFTLGDFSVSPILTYVANNMPLLSTRTVILPKSYLTSGDNPLINNKSEDESFVMMELSRPYIFPKELVGEQK